VRIIFEGDPSNLILAGRAVKWLMDRPESKDALLAYGDKEEVVLFAKRNKASISIYQQK
jgi:hypothetical protein